MSKVVKDWVQIAEYDLATAKIMLKTGRFLYVLFMCQQAIEKILKAIYTNQKKETPPRTHNLSYLADLLNLDISDLDKIFLLELNQFYVRSRYPEQEVKSVQPIDEKRAEVYFQQAKEVFILYTC